MGTETGEALRAEWHRARLRRFVAMLANLHSEAQSLGMVEHARVLAMLMVAGTDALEMVE